jgi:hypothetical protein
VTLNETRRMPTTLIFPNGPTLHRRPMVRVIGPAVVTEWVSESGRSRLAYSQRVACDDQGRGIRRALVLLTAGAQPVPLTAIIDASGEFFPDNDVIGEYLPMPYGIAPCAIAEEMTDGVQRPGVN